MLGNDNHVLNRREFIAIGVTGATTLVAGLNSLGGVAEGAAPTDKPVYRTLGRTGLKVTIVSFGAMLTPEYEVIQAGFGMGINYVDTARRYMNGMNEEIVGKALKGWRDKVYVATKTKPASNTKGDIIKDVETSLSKLSTDYIDVLQLHNLEGKDRVYIPEVREALLSLRKAGKVRFFGVTTHKNQTEVVDAVLNDPEKFFDVILIAYNFKSDPEIKKSIAKAAAAGIGIVAMKTQTGAYHTDEMGGVSPHQAALRWVLQDPNVTAAIPGMKDMSMLKEDIAVMGMVRLTRADEEILARYGASIEHFYCRFCGKCESTCPNHVEVSTVNRCLMYAEGYRSPDFARLTYAEIAARANAGVCLDCAACTARCVHGIDIAGRMRRARELFA